MEIKAHSGAHLKTCQTFEQTAPSEKKGIFMGQEVKIND